VSTLVNRLPRYQTLAKIFCGLFYKKWDQGAYNSAFAAASPLVRANPDGYKGKYIEGDYGKVLLSSKKARDPGLAADLWTVTETFVKSKGLDANADVDT
jgi:hypothetical protein